MKSYTHIDPMTGKQSSVIGYDYGDDYISVYFKSGRMYTYTLQSCGSFHLNTLKKLADAQNGLGSYLSRIKPKYEIKH